MTRLEREDSSDILPFHLSLLSGLANQLRPAILLLPDFKRNKKVNKVDLKYILLGFLSLSKTSNKANDSINIVQHPGEVLKENNHYVDYNSFSSENIYTKYNSQFYHGTFLGVYSNN